MTGRRPKIGSHRAGDDGVREHRGTRRTEMSTLTVDLWCSRHDRRAAPSMHADHMYRAGETDADLVKRYAEETGFPVDVVASILNLPRRPTSGEPYGPILDAITSDDGEHRKVRADGCALCAHPVLLSFDRLRRLVEQLRADTPLWTTRTVRVDVLTLQPIDGDVG